MLTLADAYPEAALHTSLYDPDGTFPGFAGHEVRTLPLNRVGLLRRPPPARPPLPRPVLLAHVRRRRRHALHVERLGPRRPGHRVPRSSTATTRPGGCTRPTSTWTGSSRPWPPPPWPCSPRPCAGGTDAPRPPSDRYLANSRAVRARVADVYGIDADVLHPPVDIDVEGPRDAAAGVEPGFFLCVSRLLPYKNVGAVVDAFGELPGERLVVVGHRSPGRRARRRRPAPRDPARAGRGRRAPLALRRLPGPGGRLLRGLRPHPGGGRGVRHARPPRCAGAVSSTRSWRATPACSSTSPRPVRSPTRCASCRPVTWPVDRLQALAGRFSRERFLAEVAGIIASVS